MVSANLYSNQPSLLNCFKNWSSSIFLEPSFSAFPLPRVVACVFGFEANRIDVSSITAVKGTDDELIAVVLLPRPKSCTYFNKKFFKKQYILESYKNKVLLPDFRCSAFNFFNSMAFCVINSLAARS